LKNRSNTHGEEYKVLNVIFQLLTVHNLSNSVNPYIYLNSSFSIVSIAISDHPIIVLYSFLVSILAVLSITKDIFKLINPQSFVLICGNIQNEPHKSQYDKVLLKSNSSHIPVVVYIEKPIFVTISSSVQIG